MKKGDFLINGKTGMLELNSFLESYPTITIPKRKKTFQAIEGASSQSILDENAYDNREINLSIIVRASNELDRTMRVSALVSAFDSANYIDFTYYGEPNFAYRITNANEVSQARISRVSYWTKLTFKLSAKAFKYYEPSTSYDCNGEIQLANKFSYSSRPLIVTTGSSVAINGTTYNFKNSGSTINIDCDEEQQDVYSGSTVIENAYDLTQEFPFLKAGNNVIDIQNGKIYPRWRTI